MSVGVTGLLCVTGLGSRVSGSAEVADGHDPAVLPTSFHDDADPDPDIVDVLARLETKCLRNTHTQTHSHIDMTSSNQQQQQQQQNKT